MSTTTRSVNRTHPRVLAPSLTRGPRLRGVCGPPGGGRSHRAQHHGVQVLVASRHAAVLQAHRSTRTGGQGYVEGYVHAGSLFSPPHQAAKERTMGSGHEGGCSKPATSSTSSCIIQSYSLRPARDDGPADDGFARARWRLRRQQERGGREREGRGRYCRQGTDLGCGRRGSDGSSIRSHQPIHCRATSRNVASGSSAARGRSITTASSATASSSDAHSISAGPGCSATTCHPVYRRATGRSATTGQAASCGTAGDCVALGHIGRRDAQGIHRAALGRRGH